MSHIRSIRNIPHTYTHMPFSTFIYITAVSHLRSNSRFNPLLIILFLILVKSCDFFYGTKWIILLKNSWLWIVVSLFNAIIFFAKNKICTVDYHYKYINKRIDGGRIWSWKILFKIVSNTTEHHKLNFEA